jgi:lysine N6-hydroxylase
VIEADVVILATGYRFELPGWLDPIVADLEMEGQEIALNDDFSAKWNRPVPNRIYMQNAGRMQWGVADPNLSLISWRSGKIINSLLGYSAYDLEDRLPAIDWTSRSDPLQGQASA